MILIDTKLNIGDIVKSKLDTENENLLIVVGFYVASVDKNGVDISASVYCSDKFGTVTVFKQFELIIVEKIDEPKN